MLLLLLLLLGCCRLAAAGWLLPAGCCCSALNARCRGRLPAPQAHASSLGAVLSYLCCTVLDAVSQLPPSDRPKASVPAGAIDGAGAGAGASAVTSTQPSPPASTMVASAAAAAAAGDARPLAAADSAACAIDMADLLPIDRALVTSPELRQTCNAIELLRSAAREGPPLHEWKLSGFSSQGPSKVSSPSFELFGRRWSLLLHPRGCGANAQGTHVSAYLRLEHGSACDARVRLAVRNHHSPTLSTFNKPWQWRFESNGKNRGVSSLLPLTSANADAGFVVDDSLVLQLWLRPLGAAESRCLPPGAEDGLPHGDLLQPAARRYFHSKLLLCVWLSSPTSSCSSAAAAVAPTTASSAAASAAASSAASRGGSSAALAAGRDASREAEAAADDVQRLLEQLAPSSCSSDPAWATERHRLQLLALNAAAADGHKDALVALLESGWLHPVQLHLTHLPPAYAKYAGPYEQVSSPRRYSYGRPVYRSGHCYLFYAEERDGKGQDVSQWVLGREEDLGRTNGWMFVDDDALSPDLIQGEFQIWDERGSGSSSGGSSSGGSSGGGGAADCGSAWHACSAVRVVPSAPFLVVGASLTPLHYAAWGGQLECTNLTLKACKPYSPNPVPPKLQRRSGSGAEAAGELATSSVMAAASSSASDGDTAVVAAPIAAQLPLGHPDSFEGESPLLLAARGTAGAAPVVQLLAAEGFCDHRALGAAATHTVRIGLLEAALLRHPPFMALVRENTATAAPPPLHRRGCTAAAAPPPLHRRRCTAAAAPPPLHRRRCIAAALARPPPHGPIPQLSLALPPTGSDQVHDPFAQLARAVERFPKPLGAALSNLLGWFSCSLYRDGSTVGPFGSISAPCQEAVLWRVAEAVLMPPGSTGSTTPLHL